MPSFLSLLSSPAMLGSLLAIMTSSAGTLFLKSCTQSQELTTLRAQHTTLLEDYSRAQTNLAVVQADLAKQASEITRYNNLASRYRKELESKYTLPAPTHQDCAFDFTLANTLLTRQGR